MRQGRSGAAQNGKHLSDAQLQTATDATYTNLDNFIKEKQSAADTVTNIGTVAGAIGLTYVTGRGSAPAHLRSSLWCRV